MHEPLDAVKAVMAGADVVQVVSALLKGGPTRLTSIRDGFEEWGERHGYDSIAQMRGCASLAHGANPDHLERNNYLATLRSPRDPVATHHGWNDVMTLLKQAHEREGF